jgi:hypothetical protein
MDLDQEILARINAEKSLKKSTRVEDFQARVSENGTVLVNLRTSRAQLLYDDDSALHDLEDLKLNTIKS